MEIQLTRIGQAVKMRAKGVELTKVPLSQWILCKQSWKKLDKQTEMAEQLVSQRVELDSVVELVRDRVETLRRKKEAEVSKITEELIQEQGKVRYIWHINCEQLQKAVKRMPR